MGWKRKKTSGFHNTVSRVVVREKDREALGYRFKSDYTPFSKYMGYDPPPAERNALIKQLLGQYKGDESEAEVIQKIKSELNRYKKGRRAWLKGRNNYWYKGENFWVDTEIRRSTDAREKLFPIINTETEEE